MDNPFQKKYTDATDQELVEEALGGSRASLEALVRRHQDYIHNVALRMVLSPFDAEDITQEVLIKVITKLSQFQGRSSFRTWLYRIVVNHFLQMKRYWLEDTITTFDSYGEDLDNIADNEMTEAEQLEYRELITEARIGCMAGMLLCLSREQRLVYILGEIFQADHSQGAEILDISKDNFRQRLHRARRDLYQFMNKKCGLVNTDNPCRCHRKTRGFIAAGWVDSSRMKFNTDYVRKVYEVASAKADQLDDCLGGK